MNAIELSTRELERINQKIFSELEKFENISVLDFKITSKNLINRMIEESIQNILNRIDNFKPTNEKIYIKMCVKMNRQKYRNLRLITSYEKVRDIIKSNIKTGELTQTKKIAKVKPRMGTPTIVID